MMTCLPEEYTCLQDSLGSCIPKHMLSLLIPPLLPTCMTSILTLTVVKRHALAKLLALLLSASVRSSAAMNTDFQVSHSQAGSRPFNLSFGWLHAWTHSASRVACTWHACAAMGLEPQARCLHYASGNAAVQPHKPLLSLHTMSFCSTQACA